MLRRSVTILTVSLLFGTLLGQAPESAEAFNSNFWSILCDRDPGVVETRDAIFPPSGCVRFGGIKYELWTPDGALLGSCTTDETGWCGLGFEIGNRLVLYASPDSFPAGYQPQLNPLVFYANASMSGIAFIPEASLAVPTDGARVTVHIRTCAPGYRGDNWYDDCHGNASPFRQAFQMSGPTARSTWTGAAGDAEIDHLAPGRWQLLAGLPSSTARTYWFCSRVGEPGVPFEGGPLVFPSFEAASASAQLDLNSGDDVLCDIYSVPTETGSTTAWLTFRPRWCESPDPPDLIYETCFENTTPGLHIWVLDVESGRTKTSLLLGENGDGSVELPPGRYGMEYTEDDSDVLWTYVYCAQAGRPDTGAEGYAFIYEGEHWICDVYEGYAPED